MSSPVINANSEKYAFLCKKYFFFISGSWVILDSFVCGHENGADKETFAVQSTTDGLHSSSHSLHRLWYRMYTILASFPTISSHKVSAS